MKTLHKILLMVSFIAISITAFCQDRAAAKALISQGIALNDSGKYAEAVAKYQQALKADTGNVQAEYEMSYTLSASGKPDEAIPFLEKVIRTNTYPEAYDLIASIYDDKKDFDHAITYYKQGIAAFPNYQRLRFNIGISYLRQKKYPEAEAAAVKAIQLDPKHASSQRLYALATYGEDKRGMSLLAWCSFLLLEPQTRRSPEAFQYMEKIINYGVKETGKKSVTITVSPGDMDGPNFLMPMTVVTAVSDKKGLSKVDTLALELKSLFEISDTYNGKKPDAFYKSFFSDYFSALAVSGNVPAFARFISVSVYQDESVKWLKENQSKLNALDGWVTTTKREP